MATPPEQPWSNHEKNYLLAEIIKSANPSANVLFDVIRTLNIQPRWEETPLPSGRSLNSCRYAFDDLRKSLSVPLGGPIAPNTPKPLSGPVPSLKRPYQYEVSYAAGSSGREIRPKPSTLNASYSQPSPTEQPPVKRKRGRPTKAEALAKAEAAAASCSAVQSDLGPTSASRAPVPPQPVLRSIQPTSVPTPQGVAKAAPLISTSGMPIAAMLTPTARAPPSASQSHSGSSSGRRRRARSAKSELEGSPGLHMTVAGRHDYESPYTRAEAPDEPARAAVLRHREDSSGVFNASPQADQAAEQPSGPGSGPPT